LDHLDLLVAGVREDHVDGAGGFVFASSCVTAATTRGSRGRRGNRRGRHAELLLERLDPLGELEHGDALELLDPISCAGCHLQSSFGLVSASSGSPSAETSAWFSVCCAGSSEAGSASSAAGSA